MAPPVSMESKSGKNSWFPQETKADGENVEAIGDVISK